MGTFFLGHPVVLFNIFRMSVAICSILAAKISTEETSELGSHSNYMKKLLSIVRDRMTDHVMDITLKFTLSALWNLTDESPRTCKGNASLVYRVS